MPEEPMTANEAVVARWLSERKVKYRFWSELLGPNPDYGVVVPFVLEDWRIGIGFSDEMDRVKRAVLATQGVSYVALSSDDPIASLEEIAGG
jgi:hypothetical protein